MLEDGGFRGGYLPAHPGHEKLLISQKHNHTSHTLLFFRTERCCVGSFERRRRVQRRAMPLLKLNALSQPTLHFISPAADCTVPKKRSKGVRSRAPACERRAFRCSSLLSAPGLSSLGRSSPPFGPVRATKTHIGIWTILAANRLSLHVSNSNSRAQHQVEEGTLPTSSSCCCGQNCFHICSERRNGVPRGRMTLCKVCQHFSCETLLRT